jgi:alpha-tubulin suppressor-like RCC1 family protein
MVPAGLSGVTAISAGLGHSLALRSDGTVVAWGRHDEGQTSVPAGLRDVVAVAGGDAHSLALKKDGTVVAWGSNVVRNVSPPNLLAGQGHCARGAERRDRYLGGLESQPGFGGRTSERWR